MSSTWKNKYLYVSGEIRRDFPECVFIYWTQESILYILRFQTFSAGSFLFILIPHPRLLDIKCFFPTKIHIFCRCYWVVTRKSSTDACKSCNDINERGRCTTRITPFSFKTQRHFIPKTFEIKHDLLQGFLNQALTKAWVAMQWLSEGDEWLI